LRSVIDKRASRMRICPVMASQFNGGSGVFFYREASDLERALRNDPSPRARALATEAKRIAVLFEDWQKLRDNAELKAEAIRQLFALNRAVLEYTGAASSPSSRVRPASIDNDDDE